MSHSWDSPARLVRDALCETLEQRIGDRAARKEIIELAIEEFDSQLALPDDEMIEAGVLVLDEQLRLAAATLRNPTPYRRRIAVERIWRAMADKAFDR